MTDADALLEQLWAVDRAPERDASFRLAVVDRLARRRVRRDLLTYAAFAIGLAAAAWGLAPMIAEIGQVLTGGMVAATVAAVLLAVSFAATLPAAFSRA